MNSIELELFDEYKHVDKICREMYNSEKGVSEYIEQMDATPMAMRYRIAGWENDYKQLKHIRWVRNQLAHSTDYVECTQADVDWLRSFHTRLINRTDPLAVVAQLEREAQAARVKSKPQRTVSTVTPKVYANNTKRKKKKFPVAIAIACVAAAAALIVLLLWFMTK